MSRYYGVIGNRDHIKIGGDRRPFWEFLDVQPDGWLTSLAYHAKVLPDSDHPMIWDCGAWSYKLEETPKLGKNLVTPEWVLQQYVSHARSGDFAISPDHMLLPGVGDHDARRTFNLASARAFLEPAREAGFLPMATAHGATLEERVDMVRAFYDMGYPAIALGGLAGQASRRAVCREAVTVCREVAPDVYLHVLGLSSPPFAALWHHLGVDSYDGSSHFKQAFAGGAFFVADGPRMTKHSAVRPGEAPTAPECDCLACTKLRGEGIDTRTFGSNEHNMGRAAHNLNHLMRAQAAAVEARWDGQLSWSLA